MKISKIEEEKELAGVYKVTLIPNFIERLFGVKEKNKRFKDAYAFSLKNGRGYSNEKGKLIKNGNFISKAIDNWKRSF